MEIVSYADGEMAQVVPGFEILEISVPSQYLSVARIKMTKLDLPRYPAQDFSSLDSDMVVTVLSGTIFYCSIKMDRKLPLSSGDTLFIPRKHSYYWLIETATVVLLAINNPPFNPEERTI